MFESYGESVLFYCDDRGELDIDIIEQVLEEHSTCYDELVSDGYDGGCNGEALLSWLGY